ncbi:MAG: PadR family transcriptional regulator [Candidatus Hodarchaeota archaeon]
MTEELVNRLGKAMKKGFISTLVLLVLKEEPSHGYQIIKAIEERTLGFWKPTTSTIYTVLKDLMERNLIELVSPLDDDDTKKIYRLTTNGQQALSDLMKTEEEMRDSMIAIMASTFGFSDDLLEENSETPPFLRPFSGRLKGKSKEEKLKILKFVQSMMEKRLQNIEEQIHFLEKSEEKLK